MAVRFLHSFRGRETNERYYEAGQVVQGDALEFLAPREIVEIIEDERPAPNIVIEEKEIIVEDRVIPVKTAKKGKVKR